MAAGKKFVIPLTLTLGPDNLMKDITITIPNPNFSGGTGAITKEQVKNFIDKYGAWQWSKYTVPQGTATCSVRLRKEPYYEVTEQTVMDLQYEKNNLAS